MNPENNIEAELARVQHANETYDKLLYLSERVKNETSELARLVLMEQCDNYLDFSLQFDLAPIFKEIKEEREM